MELQFTHFKKAAFPGLEFLTCDIDIFPGVSNDTEKAWSAFEREYWGLKEGYSAIAKYVVGFRLFVYFDHKKFLRMYQKALLISV